MRIKKKYGVFCVDYKNYCVRSSNLDFALAEMARLLIERGVVNVESCA